MIDSISRQLIVAEALRRKWQISYVGKDEFFYKITRPDGRWEMLRGTQPMRSSANGVRIARDKALTMEFIQSYGYIVPDFTRYERKEQAIAFLKQYGTVVVKPSSLQQSIGVTTNITSEARLMQAIQFAQTFTPRVVLQQQLVGKLYRVFVLNGKMVAAAERTPAEVTGNGVDTISQLVEALNDDPRRGTSVDTPLKKVPMGGVAAYIGKANLTRIPLEGERVRVSAIESVSAGGQAIELTDRVHETWQKATERLAVEAGLFVCGYDIMCEDIGEPIANNYLPILELNASPGLKIHEYPTGGGAPIHIAPLYLDALFEASVN